MKKRGAGVEPTVMDHDRVRIARHVDDRHRRAKRRELLDQMQDILDGDPPWILIGYTYHLPMWQKYVKGLAMDQHAFSLWSRVETAWIDK